MKVKTSVSLSSQHLEALKAEALRERRSMSQVIEMFIEKALPDVLNALRRRTHIKQESSRK